ncbi:hypothetical protein PG984_003280 [Apiospora sp. TS-2023a]
MHRPTTVSCVIQTVRASGSCRTTTESESRAGKLHIELRADQQLRRAILHQAGRASPSGVRGTGVVEFRVDGTRDTPSANDIDGVGKLARDVEAEVASDEVGDGAACMVVETALVRKIERVSSDGLEVEGACASLLGYAVGQRDGCRAKEEETRRRSKHSGDGEKVTTTARQLNCRYRLRGVSSRASFVYLAISECNEQHFYDYARLGFPSRQKPPAGSTTPELVSPEQSG